MIRFTSSEIPQSLLPRWNPNRRSQWCVPEGWISSNGMGKSCSVKLQQSWQIMAEMMSFRCYPRRFMTPGGGDSKVNKQGNPTLNQSLSFINKPVRWDQIMDKASGNYQSIKCITGLLLKLLNLRWQFGNPLCCDSSGLKSRILLPAKKIARSF